jgi:hypothetical protein
MRAIRVRDLSDQARRELTDAGFKLDDKAANPVISYYGHRLTHKGDYAPLADIIGVPAMTLYQWGHRNLGNPVHAACAARRRAHSVRMAMEAIEREQKRLEAATAWAGGASAEVATGLAGHSASGRIADLRKRFGEQVVPIRSPWIWTHR